MRSPDYVTFMSLNDRDKQTWYQFLLDVANGLPLTGPGVPNGTIKANASCLYVQSTAGVSTLWFNTLGSGNAAGWVVK
jgi:hypothetical protein